MFKHVVMALLISIILFFSGLVVGIHLNSGPEINTKDIKTTQISGEKITHSNYSFSGDTIKLNTEAEGRGEIQTEIPKNLIPEANAWINKVHCIQGSVLYQYHNNLFISYSLAYYHRFKAFGFGGGIIFSKQSAGALAGLQWWF